MQRRGPPKITVVGFTIVRLDPAIIRNTLLTALTTRHFHGDDAEVDYRIAIVQKDDASNVVWESEPGVAASITAAPDVTQGFMAPRADQMFIFGNGEPSERGTATTGNRAPPPSACRRRAPALRIAASRLPAPGSRLPAHASTTSSSR